MKYLSMVCFALILGSCGQNEADLSDYKCSIEDTATGADISCPGEDPVVLSDGYDGVAGSDGLNGVVLSTVQVLNGDCTEVSPGIYVENIKNGRIFDVYYNAQCADSLGEYCDNVMAQYGSSGSYGQNKPGSGTVCWVGNTQFSGIRLDNGDLIINILDFN